MHAADILSCLKKRKLSYAKVAARNHCSPQAVRQVATGISTSERIANAIAEAIDKPVDRIWPGKYTKQEVIDE